MKITFVFWIQVMLGSISARQAMFPKRNPLEMFDKTLRKIMTMCTEHIKHLEQTAFLFIKLWWEQNVAVIFLESSFISRNVSTKYQHEGPI